MTSEGGPSRQVGRSALVSEEMNQRLQGALDRWAEEAGHRGVSAAVILASGAEWVGVAGRESSTAELTPAHLIWIASITKTMTGAVILGLAEEGVLSLDDPVSKWLEARKNVDPAITIRQLLNHTDGLSNYSSSSELRQAIAAHPNHLFSADELLDFVGPPHFEPGARTEYTNTAFVLLGKIAEAATHKSITDLYRERLWGPLGLTDIFLPGFQGPPGPVATAWAGRGAETETQIEESTALISTGSSAFGLFSNARTVARWGRALFTGQAFAAGVLQEMLEFVPAAGNIRGESGAGLGIRKYSYLGREQWGHSGGSALGSSLLLYDPQSQVTVAVLMNQGSGAHHFVLAPALLAIATRE